MASPQCCANPPTLSPACGDGIVVDDLGGVRAYTAGSPNSKIAVLLISDVYGFEAPNLRKIADKIATSGFFVVVPDLLYDDPYSADNPERPISIWIQSHSPDKGCQDAKPIIAALKNKGISAVGAAGFCWGGKVVFELAKSSEIEAAVLCHPSFVNVDDVKGIPSFKNWSNSCFLNMFLLLRVETICFHHLPGVKCPISILGAENDHISPPELLKQFERALSLTSEERHIVKIFPGVAHGWTVRHKADDAAAVKRAQEAHQDMLNWFIQHVKKEHVN
uniref:Dienelactone hydrolase domain-containing protein n=1 Tax=Musa acuminata subsp. malaccensis TaxID=214687 RepID=A0A804KK97_MUSAM|nr:PREDICTED: endo-1,3;1,4-beta-D-glucanase-like isoform X1 [Musa acuminata subsp. malaccensis]